jgi:tetratricopeptide (TPR) repeat protein
MIMSKFSLWLLPLILLIGGCAKSPTPAAVVAAAAAPIRESRVLCLADPAGSTANDAELRRFQTTAREYPVRADAWVATGRNWVRKARMSSDPGFYLNVDACAREALAARPDLVPALELQSLVLLNDHRFEQAGDLTTKILTLAPNSALANGSLSDALLEMGRYQEAAAAVQAQMDAHPGMAASARAAHLNWLKGDTRSAKLFILDALRERSADDPESAAWVFVEAAMIYWHQGDYAGAGAIFSEALRWQPDYPPALVGRGRVALAQGRAAAAIADLEKAQRLQPLAETAWLLGDAHTLAGNSQRANASYEDALRQGRRGDRLTLAQFLASKNRDVGQALRLLEQERADRGGIYVDDATAWALYRAGRIDEASRFSAQAMRLGTQDARLIYHAGAIALAAGDGKRGRALIMQALRLNPAFDFSGAAEARALLSATPNALARN